MPSSPLKPGDRFGRYELVEVLGKGGMGEVYRAQDTVLHRSVALKVLRPMLEGTGPESSPTQGAARLLREARSAAALTHPNAIAIYDVGEVDGVPFLAMELVSGKTLRAYIGAGEAPLARRIRWLLDVAAALGAAHHLGLVHRDVKPENVMVRDDGVVKVLDFGIARRTTTKAEAGAATEVAAIATLTASGVVVGTPFYMAPEQMRGEPLDGRADQFAWGVMAYELLTGESPWDRDASGLQLVSQILSREVAPPREKNPQIGPVVNAVIRRALAKSARQRFDAMEEIVHEIEPDAAPVGVTTGRAVKRRPISLSDAEQIAPTQAVPASSRGSLHVPSTGAQLVVSDVKSAPARRNRRWMAGALVASVVGAGAWVGIAARRGAPPAVVPSGAAAPSDAATREPPMSSNPEARAAYATAVQSIRDAAMDVALRELKRAVTLDPEFAAAYLRTALVSVSLNAPARDAFTKANGLRANLSDHDRELLASFEPLMGSSPDPRLAVTRLEKALAHTPGDPELLFYLGKALWFEGDWEAAAHAFDETLARDPDFVLAIRYKAYSLANAGKSQEASDLYKRCLERSPDATACAWDLTLLLAIGGACDEEERLVRDQIARHGATPFMSSHLARVLYARGSPEAAVLAVLQGEWQRSGDAPSEASDRTALDVLHGDFTSAAAHALAWERALGDEEVDSDHATAFAARMKIALETGRTSDVAAQAREYEAHRAAWPLNPFAPDGAITIEGLSYRAGVTDRDTFGKQREAWLARNGHDTGLFEKSGPIDRWFQAYALPCVTPDDAAEAIKTLPGRPPDAFLVEGAQEPIGEMYRLAGRTDEAIAALGGAAHSCMALDQPFETTWAAYELGDLLGARGDAAGACREYGVVLARWGRAVPASRTAALARQRARSLACAP